MINSNTTYKKALIIHNEKRIPIFGETEMHIHFSETFGEHIFYMHKLMFHYKKTEFQGATSPKF